MAIWRPMRSQRRVLRTTSETWGTPPGGGEGLRSTLLSHGDILKGIRVVTCRVDTKNHEKKDVFLHVTKIDKDIRETSETCSRVTTSDLETI